MMLDGEPRGAITVHIEARVAAAAGAGQILVSSTVRDLAAGSGFRFVTLSCNGYSCAA